MSPQAAWFYMREGFADNEQIGPVDEEVFLVMLREGKIKKTWLVFHQIHTSGQWMQAQNCAYSKAVIDDATAQRRAAKESVRRERAERKAAMKQEKEKAKAEAIEERRRLAQIEKEESHPAQPATSHPPQTPSTSNSAVATTSRGYVENNLLAGEEVVYWATLHWAIFIGPMVAVVVGVTCIVVGAAVDPSKYQLPIRDISLIVGIPVLIAGAIHSLVQWVNYVSSEFAVTTKRVIMKTGFIRRRTLELLHDKIDSLSVDQGLLARIFNFGTVAVTVAVEKQVFPFVADPLEFRRQVQQRATG